MRVPTNTIGLLGNSNPDLVKSIVKILGIPLGKLKLSPPSDNETHVELLESVRGYDVFIIQPTCPPVNDNLMQLLITIDAIKRSSPLRITTVIPYYGYSRQDRKHGPRQPITAKLVADLISTSGSHRVLMFDLHAAQILGFFDFPCDDLNPDSLIIEYLNEKKLNGKNTTIIAINAGGARRARRLARKFGSKIALIETRTQGDRRILNIVGSLEKNCVIIDDMIDTGVRVCASVEALKGSGAEKVLLWATHAVLSGDIQTIQNSELDEIVVTDTVPISPEKRFPKLKIYSVAPILAEAIRRIHNEESLTEILNDTMTTD